MARCTSCSAPLPPDAFTCDYCGCRNDVDLKGVHYYTTHECDSERICPRCSIPLRTIDLNLNGTFLIERCDDCFGLFFDPNELETLLDATATNVYTIDKGRLDNGSSRRGEPYGVTYIKCPVCSTIMNRVNFGIKSGVIVDRCKEHGIWLDCGELRNLLEWMKAGGKLLQQEREEQRKHEEQHEKERQTRAALAQTDRGAGYPDDTGFTLYGGTLRSSDPDLFDIVLSALRFVIR